MALADVDQSVLDGRAKDAEELGGKRPTLYRDYRKLLDDKDVDAVIVGTPDHWHCLILVDALAAGKHVYVEKPVANSIEEARVMLAAAAQVRPRSCRWASGSAAGRSTSRRSRWSAPARSARSAW